jgi:hypothetical protein
VIQNRLNSQEPPMAEATNEWNDESTESRKDALGVRCNAPSFLGTAGDSGRRRSLPSRPGTAEIEESWITILIFDTITTGLTEVHI